MNANAHKLEKLENVRILEHINSYFKELNRNNRDYEDYYDNQQSKTQLAYESDVRLFFRIVKMKEKGSELEYLSLDDLQLTLDDLEYFKQELCDMRNEDGKYTYKNKSINRKLAAIKSFARGMAKRKIDGEPLIKDVSFLSLVTSEKVKESHYGALSIEECFEMAEWCLTEREKGEIKRLAVLFSLDTCIRKSALLRLKWTDFTEKEDGYEVKGIDKGNSEFRQLISKEFYNELLTIKKENSQYVFNISSDSLDNMMIRYRKAFNIPKERRIVWHSIRKTGVTFRFRLTNDIMEAKRAAGHKSITTTQIYIEDQDYGQIGAVSSAGKIDMELYKNVDLKTLVEAISMMKKDNILILNMKIQEILRNK
ncbi:site-specific integrase [Neobacillus sp. YIM B02564]|uniref:Site-specific integrase n=1 Tax=Neobacillus paridis TaxID=2803862 RepID=A0ABS1TIA0_9BACI|nr:site-specific integrase [Neobacillus paridis]MBL4951038.1 site-specific integrase [Neobacillus paridis]